MKCSMAVSSSASDLNMPRRPAHDFAGVAALGRGDDDPGTPQVRRAAVAHDRLKSIAVGSRDSDDNSCSHAESLNCFGQFGNRPNESDH
jgi:hypothetical protein